MIFRKGDKVARIQGDKILGIGWAINKSQDKNRRNFWRVKMEDGSTVVLFETEMLPVRIVKKPS